MLLDTNAVIWLLTEPERVSPTIRLITGKAETLAVSIASLYEIAIKERLGRFELLEVIESEMVEQSITTVPLGSGQLRQLAALKHLKHGDPFDLLIIALAIERQLTLITSDRKILSMQLPGLQTRDARK